MSWIIAKMKKDNPVYNQRMNIYHEFIDVTK